MVENPPFPPNECFNNPPTAVLPTKSRRTQSFLHLGINAYIIRFEYASNETKKWCKSKVRN